MASIEGERGEPLTEVWAYISPDEAKRLRQALEVWFERSPKDENWHHHVGPGAELTIAITDGQRQPRPRR